VPVNSAPRHVVADTTAVVVLVGTVVDVEVVEVVEVEVVVVAL
jgi:hypothetical protein